MALDVPFGRMIGLGTIVIGALALVTEITQREIFIEVGARRRHRRDRCGRCPERLRHGQV